jgi:hypothetical protein
MRRAKSIVRRVLSVVVVLSGASAGCVPLASEMPHTRGRWRGRVVGVDVRDGEGNLYRGAVLEIRDGPPVRWKTQNVPGGPLPLLARSERGHIHLQPAHALPIGDEINVWGTVTVNHVYVVRPREGPTTVFRGNRPPSTPSTEHVLIMEE